MCYRWLAALVLCVPVWAATEAPNVFPAGSFELLDGGQPRGWNLLPGSAVRTDGANHYLEFTNADPKNSAWAMATLKLDPEWGSLRVSARLRVANLKLGSAGWHNARLILNFRTADGKDAGFPEGPQLRADSDWVTQTVTVDVPATAATLALQPGLWGCTGVMGLDDIVVTPVVKPSPFAGPLLRLDPQRGLVEGSFETLTDDGRQPVGWEWSPAARLMGGAGNHWVRLTNRNPLAAPAIRANLWVRPGTRALTIKVRLKTAGLKCGADPCGHARLVVSSRTIDDEPLASVIGPGVTTDTADWADLSTIVAVPPTARYLVLWIGLWQATGQLDIDDVRVLPAAEKVTR